MTDEQKIFQEGIKELIRLATQYKITICGFAFAVDNPMIVNFGNCTDAGSIKLYEALTKMCDDKRKSGQSIESLVGDLI